MDSAESARRIEAALERALRRHRAVRALEGLVLGLTAGGATAAAAVLSGAEPATAAALAPAAIAALAAAGTWWIERRQTRAELARRVDRASRSAGAFVTALECAARPHENPLATALVARTARELDPRAARAAVALPSVALSAAPLLAAALVALALEARSLRLPTQAPASLRGALGAVDEASAGTDDPELAELAKAVMAEAARAGAEPELERALTELAAGLDARAARAGLERAADFERAAAEVRAAQAALAPGPRGPEPAAGSSTAGAAGGAQGLADAGTGSTMAGSLPGADAATAERGPEPAADSVPEAGLVLGRWWDAQYDGVVSAWVQRGRAHPERARAGDQDSE